MTREEAEEKYWRLVRQRQQLVLDKFNGRMVDVRQSKDLDEAIDALWPLVYPEQHAHLERQLKEIRQCPQK